MTVEVDSEETKEVELRILEVSGNSDVQSEAEVEKKMEESKINIAESDEPLNPTSLTSIVKSSSFREESNFLSDLKEAEKKALNDLKLKIKEAINGNKILRKEENKENSDVSIWGVSLLPKEGDSEEINVVLLKFLRAREFNVNTAFEMLSNTLRWRETFKIDSILDEDAHSSDLSSVSFMEGVDKEGHPICYNVFGVFDDKELYQETFGTEEKRERFLRWRLQLMEKGIQELEFNPGKISSMVQIIDLKNSPGPSRKELRITMKKAVNLFQDNYPELVARNIIINVPLWYYAIQALLSPFLTQRTKNKFIFARPANVTETLLKYIAAEDIPTHYGGLKRANDPVFTVEEGGVSQLIIRAGFTETIEMPLLKVGSTLVWDFTVIGWEVSYKEEFVPNDEGSYIVIIQKNRKMGSKEQAVRNSFKNNEPGRVVITIENNTFWKKKVLLRCKTKASSVDSTS